ncbi:MAG: GNAT family N-acetyltransferase [Candidatus Omnitrophica bacterium]|nr:GNAT family N-acetyltransferase [Candidatus Omnitrophota bacterium]
MPESTIVIRKYSLKDREAVRKISVETAFSGEDRHNIVTDDEILADILTLYYTEKEPASCFVASSDGRTIGYLTGAKNKKYMQRTFNAKIVPELISKSITKGIIFERRTLNFLLHLLISFFKGAFSTPDFSRDYPATLHININKGFRHRGIGTQLMFSFLDFLKTNGINGVHLATASENAKVFFVKLGFTVLFEKRIDYLKYVTGRSMPYCVFGKKL